MVVPWSWLLIMFDTLGFISNMVWLPASVLKTIFVNLIGSISLLETTKYDHCCFLLCNSRSMTISWLNERFAVKWLDFWPFQLIYIELIKYVIFVRSALSSECVSFILIYRDRMMRESSRSIWIPLFKRPTWYSLFWKWLLVQEWILLKSCLLELPAKTIKKSPDIVGQVSRVVVLDPGFIHFF